MVATTAGFKGTVTEVQEATRFALAGAKAVVDTAAAFKPTSTGVRSIQLAAGTAMVCGVLVVESAPQVVEIAANAGASARLDVLGLRFTWAGDNSRVEVFVKQGVVGSSTPPALTRVAGGTYEFPLAVVRVRPSVSTIAAADVLDVRVWGGFGGRSRPRRPSSCPSWICRSGRCCSPPPPSTRSPPTTGRATARCR
ncbi:hypothetical protein ACFQZK_05715 [Rhodococcus aetherivorans]